MKAVIYEEFGGVDVLKIAEVEKPSAGEGQVLVAVRAVSINPLDWKVRQGEMKLMSGSRFPKHIGIDLAGVVEEVGSGVTAFKLGDEVFGAVNGMKEGVLGEYAAIAATSVWKKPAKLTFAQAASIPVAGCAAHQAMIDLGGVTEGSSVLLNGATGGVGMFAIPIAKEKGAVVTAVSNTEGLAYAKKWGADKTVDYTKENVLESGTKFDVVFDLSHKMPFEKARQIMKDTSVYIDPVPTPVAVVTTTVTNLFTGQKDKMLMSNPNDRAIRDLLAAVDNGMDIEVSRTFPMAEFAEAYRYAEKGGFIGKLAIEV